MGMFVTSHITSSIFCFLSFAAVERKFEMATVGKLDSNPPSSQQVKVTNKQSDPTTTTRPSDGDLTTTTRPTDGFRVGKI